MVKVVQGVSLTIAASASLIASTAVAQPSNKLTVVVDGITRPRGQVCFRLYDKDKGFPQSAAGVIQSGCTNAQGTSVIAEFHALQPGTYAVTVFHDENNDQKLNTNFLGIPREGFGISNNPPVKIGAPKFNNASFSVEGNTTITVNMRYF
ncbi:DUF2141 domain-containing protein [Gloeocapsopsis dulcis]|uniref:DUF2141 domain-containing protein n=1 Tax=Gloeocapsopsis dulcis AAB1 = 1H9 TaxID=1433147 RepID=A0A6N8FTQ4_9CHRO|nr:DUF2141 domain-containing protein [Gloeocapsopsis dulcis]MUL36239.1 hypothetical protein [Gloeocapsopsis dulcis AAB1 = 1H9]WNN89648.1 DUF2141 domain-containing protein [Gloeocapsopsis dulcis]